MDCTVAVTLVPVNTKGQVRDTLFITALHIMFSHCSVADTQDEVLSVAAVLHMLLSTNTP